MEADMRAFIDSIRAAVATGGIQKQELAAEAKLHRNSLADIESEDWNPRVKTLEQLLDALDRIRARRGAISAASDGRSTESAAA